MILLNDTTVPAVQTDVGVINNVTIPAVRNTAEQAATDATALQGKFPITATDISDGAISTPQLSANAIDGMTVTGALIRTAVSGQRVEIKSSNVNRVDFYSGAAGEVAPGNVRSLSPTAGQAQTSVTAPTLLGVTPAELNLASRTDIGASQAFLTADEVKIGPTANTFVSADEVQIESTGVDRNLILTSVRDVAVSAQRLIVNAVPVVTTTGAQTLTNKDLRDATNVMPIRGGNGTFTGNGSGVITIPHGLGTTPTWAMVIAHGTAAYFATIAGFTATTIVANIVNKDGTGTLGSSSLPVSWVCGITTA
jgi:hypothetical protein